MWGGILLTGNGWVGGHGWEWPGSGVPYWWGVAFVCVWGVWFYWGAVLDLGVLVGWWVGRGAPRLW